MAPKSTIEVTTPVGAITWSALFTPKESLSNSLEWTLGLELTDEDAAEIAANIADVADAGALAHPGKWPAEFNIPLVQSKKKNEQGVMEPKEGLMVLKAKRKYEINSKTGRRRNTAPVVVDSKGKPVDADKFNGTIPSGSKVRAKVSLFAYGKGGSYGVAACLNAVQVVELAEDTTSFDAIEGGWSGQPEPEVGGSFDNDEFV